MNGELQRAMETKPREEKRSELQSVRDLLKQWRRWKRRWWPHLGYPSSVPYIDEMRPIYDSYTEGEDYDEIINAEVMRQMDQAIEKDLTPNERIAISIVYLNEIGPAVWRSNRVPKAQAYRLCREAEVALIPALRRRNVQL